MAEPQRSTSTVLTLPSLKAYPSLLHSWLRLPEEKKAPMLRRWALEDLYFLLRYLLRRTDVEKQWIFDRCREVQESPDNHIDLWARFHYKSTIITYALTIQEILKNPEITVGIFSHTRPAAKDFLRQIKREFESNAWLKSAFPDILHQNPQKDALKWSEDDGIIVRRSANPKEATVEAWGLVDGMPTGKHFDLMIYDDVVTKEAVTSPEMVQKTTDAVRLSYALGHEYSKRRMIGTRYNYADSYDSIMKDGTFEARIYPATDKSGEPVLVSKEALEKMKRDMGDYIYACQMLQNPIAGSQAMFNVEDIQTYEVRPQTLNAYILIDPARSRKKDSANTAMAVLGLDYAGNKYLLDGFNHRMDLQERWQALRMLYYKWIREPGIQSVKVGYEKFGAQADLDYFQEKMRVERSSFPIEELEWPREGDGSKIDRVQRLGPDLRGHKLFLPYPTDANRLTSNQQRIQSGGHPYRISQRIRRKDSDGNLYDLAEQLRNQIHYFPFGTLKDLVDAVSRIYDMSPTPPIMIDESSLEPEYV